MEKNMLDGLNFSVTKLLVPQEKNLLGRSQLLVFIGEN